MAVAEFLFRNGPIASSDAHQFADAKLRCQACHRDRMPAVLEIFPADRTRNWVPVLRGPSAAAWVGPCRSPTRIPTFGDALTPPRVPRPSERERVIRCRTPHRLRRELLRLLQAGRQRPGSSPGAAQL